MQRPTIDLVVRFVIIASLLLTSSPWPALASPIGHAAYQVDPPPDTPTTTPAPGGTEEPAPNATEEPVSTVTEESTPSAAEEPGATATEGPVPGVTETAAPTETATVVPTETTTVTGTVTATATTTPTTPPSETPTSLPTATPTVTPTATIALTPTATLTSTATATLTPTATATPAPVELGLTMQAQPAFVQPGALVTVSLTLSNPAQVAVDNLVISATLPAEIGFDHAAGPVSAGYNPFLHLLRWQIPAGQTTQAALTFGYVGRIVGDAPATALNLAAEISSPASQSGRQAQTSLIISPPPAPPATPALAAALIEAGPPARLQLGLEAIDQNQTGPVDQSHWLAVYVVDDAALAVADGAEVSLEIQGGTLQQEVVHTRNGVARTRFKVSPGQPLLITARAGEATGQLQLPADRVETKPPFHMRRADERYGPDVLAMIRARNAVRPAGTDLVAENRARRVDFDRTGLTFELVQQADPQQLQAAAGEPLRLGYRLTGVRVGNEPLPGPTEGQADPAGSGNWASYAAAGSPWQLAYEVGDATVEQYFVFEALPGDGDLVIEGQFQTRLEPVLLSDEEGIRFVSPGASLAEAPEASLGYGPAVVEDGRGRRLTARLELRDNRLRITVPGAWLARAEFPVVIDPVIGPAELVSALQGDALRPAIAYDGANFLTVWEWNGDVYGQLVDANGALTGTMLAISQADGSQIKPEVVYNPDSDEYLVAWIDQRYGEEYRGLYAQRLDPDGALVGSEIEVVPPYRYLGYFGGVKADLNENGEYLLVWAHYNSGPGYDVFGQRLNQNGVKQGAVIEISGAVTEYQRDPSVAYDDQSDTFLVAWIDRRQGSEYDLYSQHLDASGVLSGTAQLLVDISQNLYETDLAANDNGQFLVTYHRKNSSDDYDVYALRVNAATGAAVGSPLGVDIGSGTDRYPAVTAISSSEYMVVWAENSWRINVRRVGSDGSLPGSVLANIDNGSIPAIVYAGGQALAVWEDKPTAGQRLITGQRLSTSDSTLGDLIYVSPYYTVRERVDVAYQAQRSEYLVTWHQAATSPSEDIFGQRVDRQGRPLAEAVNLTNQPNTRQRNARLAAGANGYLVIWEDWDSANSTADIYAHLLDQSGQLSGTLLTLSTDPANEVAPNVVYNPDDDEYLAAWEDITNGEIYYQLVESDGDLKLASPGSIGAAGDRGFPQMAYDPQRDQYLMTFHETRTGTQSADIFAQRINADGSLAGASYAVMSAANGQYRSAVAYSAASHTYLAVWGDPRDGQYDVYGQVISSDGASLIGGEFLISSAGENQEVPDVVARSGDATAEFVVVWQDRRNDYDRDIYLQRVDTSGNLLDEPDTPADETDPTVNLPIAVDSANYYERPAGVYNPDDGLYLLAWDNQDDGGVYVQRYTSSSLAAPTASFTASLSSGVAPLTVTFNDTSTGQIGQRAWNFGDGADPVSTSALTMEHTFVTTGAFTVVLTVSNPGGSDVASTVITVSEQTTPQLTEDFEAYDLGVDPLLWLDQEADTDERDEFKVFLVNGSKVFGTDDEGDSRYSTYAIPGWSAWQNYEVNGRMMMTAADGGMGVAAYSRFPAGEALAYRWRKSSGQTVELVPVGTTVTGETGSGITPQANVWYQFRLQLVSHPARTTVRARLWPEGQAEPLLWQALAEDDSGARITGGAVGFYTSGPGSKYFDDLVVTPLAIQADFKVLDTQGLAPFTTTLAAGPLGQVLTYTWDFGDGSALHQTSVPTTAHTYTTAGVYTVSLTVAGPAGSDALTRTNYVTVFDPGSRVVDDLQVLYTFEEGSGPTVTDVSGAGTPLDLTIGDTNAVSWGEGYLAITSTTLLASGVAATKVISTSKASDELTVEAWLEPANLTQSGPARIVSLSADASNRNFTLGQSADLYDFRLRTTTNNNNGTNPSVSSPAGSLTTDLTHVVYTRDVTGAARIYLDHVAVVTVTIDGDLSNWNDGYQLVMADEVTGSRPWLGELHLVAVYSRALSPAEIEQNYQAGPDGGQSSEAPIEGLAISTDSPTGLGQTTTLTATITSGANVTYTWAFGDGQGGTGAVVTHTYLAPDIYPVVVTASNSVSPVVTATTGIIVFGDPELTISKTAPLTATAGDPITYTLTVTNTGGLTFTNLVITDAIPSGANYNSGGIRVDDVVSWTVASLAPDLGATEQFVVTATATITNNEYVVVAGGGTTAVGQAAVVTIIYAPPQAGFSAFPYSDAAPALIYFFDNSTGVIDDYFWTFGDGLTSTLPSPTHTYTAAGVYTVSLTVSGPGGSDVLTEPNYITVYEPVVADFSATPRTGLAPLTVTFTNSSTGASTYWWDFGDGLTDTVASPIHPYSQPGVYTVSLVASNGVVSNTLTRPAYITVTTPVTLARAFAFGADAWTRATYNEPGVDYVKVTQDGQNFAYSAGQGHGYVDTTDIDATPNNRGVYSGDDEIYDQFMGARDYGDIIFRIDLPNGQYRFVAAGGDGQYVNHSTTIAVQDGDSGAVLTLVQDYYQVAAGEFWTVSFDDKVAPPADGQGNDPVFALQAESGALTVTQGYIRVIQEVGAGSSTGFGGDLSLLELWRIEEPPELPVLNISKTAPLTAAAGAPITYTLTVTNSGSVTATNLVITDTLPAGSSYITGGIRVGDVVSWTAPSLPVSATVPVYFVVTATETITNSAYQVLADSGLSAVGPEAITTLVYPPLAVGFYADPLTGTVPLTVTFTTTSTGASTLSWNFGDGITQTITSTFVVPPSSFTHTYFQPGVYTITLTATGPNGSDTLSRTNYITVTDTAITGLTASNDSPTAVGQATTLTATVSSGSNVLYKWNFGDGTISVPMPGTGGSITTSYVYPAGGVYTVEVLASNPINVVTATTSVDIVGPVLTIHKTAPITATAGEPITYTLTVTNSGNATATQLVVLDTIPEGANYLSGGTRIGNVVSWTVDSLAVDSSAAVQLVVTATDTVVNSDYEVVTDGVSARGREAAVTFIQPPLQADFAFEVTPDPVPPVISYTVHFFDTSTGVIDSYLWDFGESASSQAVTSTLRNPARVYTQTGVYSVSLTVSGPDGSDSLTRTLTITPPPTLWIGKSGPDIVEEGEPITYTLTISNLDTVPATNLVITDAIPAGANYVGGDGTRVGEVVSWTIPGLAPGISTTVQFVVTATETITNSDYGVVADGGMWGVGGEAVTTWVTLPPNVVQATMTEEGGVITSTQGTEGLLAIDFAPGAITETLIIEIGQSQVGHIITATDEISAGLQPLADGFPFHWIELTAKRPGQDEPLIVEFQEPVTLTYTYVPTEVQNLAIDSLTFIYYNEESEQFEPIATTAYTHTVPGFQTWTYYNPDTDDYETFLASVYTRTMQVSAVITHFSTYGLAGDNAAWVTPAIDAFDVALAKGQASYSYDLPVPTGPGGFAPQLTLQYSSGMVNSMAGDENINGGWVGPGWTLDLGHIGHNTISVNGVQEELIKGSDGKYHTRHETFMDIDLIEGSKCFGNRWIVTDKNGTKYYFGKDPDLPWWQTWVQSYMDTNRPDWREVCGEHKLYKVVDIHGNTMRIIYEPIAHPLWSWVRGELYPATILYTTNVGDSHAEYKINFTIAPKEGFQSDDDSKMGERSRKLTEINMYFQQDLIRTIKFNYQTKVYRVEKEDRYAHLLKSLQIENGAELPEMTFSYVDREIGMRYTLHKHGGDWGWHHKLDNWNRPFLDTVNNGYGGVADFDYKPVLYTADGKTRALFQVVSKRTVTDTVTGLSGAYTYNYPYYSPAPPDRNLNLQMDDNSDSDRIRNITHFGYFHGYNQVKVTDPLGNVTRHYYDNRSVDYETSNILNGRETKTEHFGPGGTPLFSRSVLSWTAEAGRNWPEDVAYVYKSQQIDYICDAGCVGSKTRWDYDHKIGNLLLQEEYGNASHAYRATQYAYTPRNGNNITLPIKETLIEWDKSVGEIRYHYDNESYGRAGIGNLTAQRVWAGNGKYVDTRYEYDKYGNVTKQHVYPAYGTTSLASANPRTTSTVYDSHGLYAWRVTNPLGHTTYVNEYDYSLQVPKKETDPNGAETEYDYDAFGRLTKVWLPGCSGDPTFKAQYQDTIPHRETASQRIDDCSSGTGTYADTHVFYDGLGRKIQAHTPGDTASSFIVANVAYDKLGRTTRAGVPYEESGAPGTYDTSPDWGQGETLTEYDPLGRVTKVTQPDDSVTKTAYRNLETAVIDANRHMKISRNDPFGRLVEVKEFSGEVDTVHWFAEAYASTSYSYDIRDNLTGVTDEANNETSITYNTLGQKTAMDDPDMGQWSYGYDALGNLISQTDARGVETIMTYDLLNRLTGKSYDLHGESDVVNPGPTGYTYDAVGATANALGRRTDMTDPAGTVSWTYDARGRTLSERRLFTGDYDVLTNSYDVAGAYVISYTYDAADRAQTMSYPDGEVVTTEYTRRGLAKQLWSPWTIYARESVYDAQARLRQLRLGNELLVDYGYYGPKEKVNDIGQGGRLHTVNVGTSLLNLNYTYDAVGNITAMTDNSTSVNGQSFSFGYDHLDRLTSAGATGGNIDDYSESYAYNAIGNMSARNGESYTYGQNGAGPHAVTSVATNTYTYDDNGNMTERLEGGITYSQTWNIENKLARVEWVDAQDQLHITRFVYDGDGNRLLKIEKPADQSQEKTTVYIGQIYEEWFTATQLIDLAGLAQPGLTGGTGLALTLSSSQPEIISRPRGLASPLLEVGQPFGQTASSDSSVAETPMLLPLATAGPMDPWVDAVLEYNSGRCDNSNDTPTNIIGNTSASVSLGFQKGDTVYDRGYIIVDMGAGEEAIADGPGADLKIYEEGAAEPYRVWVSNNSAFYGSHWVHLGDGSGVKSMDLAGKMATARYVKIWTLADLSGDCPSNPGPDLSRVEALHLGAPQTLPPTITSPLTGSLYSQAAITVTGYAGSVVTVNVYVNGQHEGATTSNFEGSWARDIQLEEGINVITATAQLHGTSGPSEPVQVIYDSLPPVSTISAPVADGAQISGVYVFSGVTTDYVGVKAISYTLDSEGWRAIEPVGGTSQPWSVVVDTAPYIDGGLHSFRVQAEDQWGRLESPPVTRTFYATAPSPTTGATVTKYYYFNGQRIAMRQGGEVYYLSGDHLGSVSLTTDSAGTVVAESRYLPYGQVRWSSGAAVTDFGFTGQRNEASFGLLDYQARYYDPYLGRFISADTIVPDLKNPQSFNRFSYVYNNPILYNDPSGHCPWCVVPVVVALGLLLTGCGSVDDAKSVTVNFTVIEGSGIEGSDVDQYIQEANEVFEQADITLRKGTVDELNQSILDNGNDVLDDFIWSDNRNIINPREASIPEVENLFATGSHSDDEVTAYFVPGLLSGSYARAYNKEWGGPALIYSTHAAESRAVLEQKEVSGTFSHELGHLLLAHQLDIESQHVLNQNGNLMAPGNYRTGTKLEQWQVDIMRQSPLAK